MKIVKNVTASPINIADVGVTISANNQYIIPPQDYLLWSASSDIVAPVGVGDIVVSDGSEDLDVNVGIRLIQGLFLSDNRIVGATDLTKIGNYLDRLKVYDPEVIALLTSLSLGQVPVPDIFKHNTVSISTKQETDLASTTHTVGSGKKFGLTSFSGSYDAPGLLYVRLKKQTGGAGAFTTLFRGVMMAGGQGDGVFSYNFGSGIYVADATDVLKITYEASISKGTVEASFAGREY